MGDAKNVAESAKKVEDVTSFLKKGLSAKADVKNVMNVVSVRQLLEMGGGKGDIWVSLTSSTLRCTVLGSGFIT